VNDKNKSIILHGGKGRHKSTKQFCDVQKVSVLQNCLSGFGQDHTTYGMIIPDFHKKQIFFFNSKRIHPNTTVAKEKNH